MSYAPSVDWPMALRVSSAFAGDLPPMGERDLRVLVADLRVTARRAGALAATHLGLDSPGAARISVVDWAGWGRGVHSMIEAGIGEMGLEPRPAGALTRARARGNALLVGAGIRLLARRLLGQYDAYTGADTLYLVAPTIVAHERQHGFVPSDFRLWVCLHEQTHALQFRAAPWLKDWIGERVSVLFADESSTLQGLTAWARTGDVASLFAAGAAGEALSELVAAMTFLEGHADHTSDTAALAHIASVARLRAAFARTQPARGIGRLSPAFDKSAQYRDGLEFCRKVTAYSGACALRAAFSQPSALPTTAEIADPRSWLDRVHG